MTRITTPPEPRRNDARQRVELILSKLDELPTLPAIALRLLSRISADDISLREVVELIESDASLTAAVLRQLRRADRGLRISTPTVMQAVTLLGLNAVRNIALSVQLYDTFVPPDPDGPSARLRRELWRHNLATACAAEMLGERLGGSRLAGEAFVCGLLHDIGKMALQACMPKAYARAVDRARAGQGDLSDVEHELFGLDHSTAGKRLVSRWRLPAPIVECVWLHHLPPEALPRTLLARRLVIIVHVANAVVDREDGEPCNRPDAADLSELAGRLGLNASHLEQIVRTVPARMDRFADLLGPDEPQDREALQAGTADTRRQLARLSAELLRSRDALQRRSDALSALERFFALRCADDGIGEVCAAAAQAVGPMLRAARTAVCFLARPWSCLYLGWSSSTVDGDATPTASYDLLTSDSLEETVRGWLERACVCVERWIPVHGSGLDAVWRHAFGASPLGGLWFFPIGECDASGTAAFLTEDREPANAGLRGGQEALRGLSSAVRLALCAAAARADAERLNDDLLVVNRRLSAAQQQAVQARSLSMIAQMAAGAAHELHNPLSVISGRAQMALTQCTDEQIVRSLRTVCEQTDRASRIVTDLMRFAKPESPHPALCPLISLLEPLSQHWRQVAGLTERQLQISLREENVTVFADPRHVEEILSALLANAVQATNPAAARIEINSPSNATDETVRIVVRDNGPGMAREVLSHALDPFYSHRPAGRGRGLGLSHAWRLAESNGGCLRLQSRPGTGTAAAVELPARPPAT